MTEFAQIVLFGLTATVVFGGATWISAWSSSEDKALPKGEIGPNRTIPALAMLVALAMATSAVVALTMGRAAFEFVMIAFGAPLLAILFGLHLCSGFDISWDETKIEGPSAGWLWPFAWDHEVAYGPRLRGFVPFGPQRTTIAYRDITSISRKCLCSWVIEDSSGHCVRWSLLYPNHQELMLRLRAMRPDLFDGR